MPTQASATSLRPPRQPYGGRLFGTDAMPGNAPTYGNNPLAGQINNNVMSLLGGKNQAADQADRTNLTALSQLQKNQAAGTQRNAAQLGIMPGDPRYSAYTAKNNADQYSMGSKLLGDAQQRRLDDQSRNLNTAISFNQGQQNYGLDLGRFGLDTAKFGEDTRRFDKGFDESARRYDQDYSSNEKSKEVSTLFDIINNPLSSEGQVEAAKQRLLETQSGLNADTYNTAEKTNAQRQLDEIKSQLAVMNPGASEAEIDAMARERFATIDKAAYDSLIKAEDIDAEKKGNGGKKEPFTGPIADAGNLMSGGLVSGAKGAVHAGSEVGRGVRDIAGGDVLGGTGRIFAAPVKGVGNAVGGTVRSAGRTLRRLGNLF